MATEQSPVHRGEKASADTPTYRHSRRIGMSRTVALVGVVLLMILWPATTVGAVGPTDVVDSSTDHLSSQTVETLSSVTDRSLDEGPGDGHDDAGGNDSDTGSDERGLGHRDLTDPALFETTTSADGAPAVGESTTVTVNLTAITDVSNVTVTLPDYRFVEGDDRRFELGTVSEGETRTVTASVTPTEEIAQYLQFTARGETSEGGKHQMFVHDLALVDRQNHTGAIQLAPESRSGEFPETTTDSWGNRTPGGGGADGGSGSAASGYVEGDFFTSAQGGGGSIPVRSVRVEVWEEDGTLNPDNHIATGRTDDQGHFRIEVSDPASTDNDDVADVYVIVEAANPAVEVTSGATRVRYKVRYPSGSNGLRNGETEDIGLFTPSGSDPAFQAATWADEAYDYVRDETGFTRRQLRIQYPKTDWASYHHPYGSGGYVLSGWERITLPDRSDGPWNRGTVHHEYGHGLMWAMYGYKKSNIPNKNDYGDEKHTAYSETDPGFALIEGWAGFFEAAVADGNLFNPESNQWYNESRPNPTTSDGDPITGSDSGDMDGNKVEGSYASIWWDIIDDGPSDDDRINDSSVGFEKVFDTVKNNNVQSMKKFLDQWNHGHDEGLATTAARYGVLTRDPYQPNNQFSTAAGIGVETINATIGSGIDYYKVTIPRWTETTIDLDRLNSSRAVDLDLVVYDSSRSQVAASDSPGPNEQVTLSETGKNTPTYYIEVSNGGTPASYQLSLDGTLVDDGYEENDEVGDPVFLPGDGTERRLRLTTDRKDYYEVSLMDEGTLNVSADRGIDSKPSSFYATDVLTLELYDDDGNLIEDTSSDTGVPRINYTNEADDPEDYVVGVRGWSADIPLSYDLNVSTAPPDNDIYEPNDDSSDKVFQYIHPIEGTAVNGEYDWYARSVDSGSELNVTMPEIPGEEVDFQVYQPSAPFRVGDDGDSVVIQDTDAGVYSIRVTTVYQNTADYRLFVEEDLTPNLDVQPDRFENNDDFATATNIGRSLDSEKLTIYGSDTDYYRLELNEGDQLDVNLTYNSSHMSGSPSLFLYGPGQVPLQNAGFGDDRSVTIQDDGVYYVEVSGGGDYPYSLTVEGNDKYELNDARADAATWPIVSGIGFSYFDPRIDASMVAGEDDWYALSLTEGQRLSTRAEPTDFSVTSGLPQGYLHASIYDDQGTRLAQSAPNGEAVARAPANGTYYVRVHPWQNRSYTTDYALLQSNTAGPDAEPNDGFENATLYTPSDANETYELDDGTDADYYALYLERGEGVEVDVEFPGQSDIDVALYNHNRTALGSTTTGPFNNVSLSADTIATEDGYYYASVHGAEPNGQNYTVSMEPTEDDTFESNDDISTAAPIQFRTIEARLFEGIGDSFSRDGTPDDETDIYSVDVEERMTLNATLVFDQVGISNRSILDGSDLDLAILDSSGTELAGDTSVGDNASVQVSLSQSGTYYVRVNATGIDTVTPYELAVERDEFDPTVGQLRNPSVHLDTPVTEPAGSLLAGGSKQLRLASGANVSHVVQLQEDERLNVSSSVNGSVALALYDDSGTQLFAGGRGDDTLSFTAPTNGSYYVETTATGTGEVSTTLDVSTAFVRNDRYEPNERFGSASNLTDGSYDNLRIELGGDEDYYALDLEAGQILSVNASADAIEGPLEFTVLDPGRTVLAQRTTENRTSVAVTTRSQGTHYLRVRSAGVGFGNYSFSVDIETPNNDRFEPNDDIGSATAIGPGTHDNLTVTQGDRDVFAVSLAEGEKLTTDLNFDRSDGNLDLRLYDPGGELAATSLSDRGQESVSFRVPDGGMYYLDVRGVDGSGANYSVTLATEPAPTNDQFEPNDDIDNSTAVGAGTYQDLQILESDDDVFTVDLSSGDQFTASIDFRHTDGNLDLAVYGPDQMTVGRSDSYSDGESATVTAQTGGTHYVHVYGNADAVAPYTLEIDAPTPPPQTDWPTFQHDVARSGHNGTAVGPKRNPAAKWTVGGLSSVLASPAVHDGVVYAGTDGSTLNAFSANNGTTLWAKSLDDSVRSAPAIVDGTAYVTTRNGTLYALEAASGVLQWRFSTNGSITNFPGVLSSPAVDDGVVYFGAVNGNFYAVDASTGVEQWRFGTGDQIHSSPAVSGDTVYVGSTDDRIYALDANTGARQWSVQTSEDVDSSPTVRDGVVYVGNHNGTVRALDANNGTTRWTFQAEDRLVIASPAAPTASDRVYVASGNGGRGSADIDGHVYALDDATGNPIWSTGINGSVFSSPAVLDGVVYVGSDDSNVYALDAATGTEQWRFGTAGNPPIFDDVFSSPALASGDLYVGSDDGTFYAIEGPTESVGPEIPPIGPAVEPPTDLDSDPLLEDIDGDGQGDIGDVLAYYNNREDAAIQDNPQQFDFDGDGTSGTVFDALALYEELS